MRDYLIPNAAAFYRVLGSDEEIDQIKRACKTILINRRSTITARDRMVPLGRNRKVTRADMERIGSKLETYDWLVRTTGKHNQHNSLQWTVRPEVFSKFAKYVPAFKAEREANRGGWREHSKPSVAKPSLQIIELFRFSHLYRAKFVFNRVVNRKSRNNFGQGVGRCSSRRIIVFIYKEKETLLCTAISPLANFHGHLPTQHLAFGHFSRGPNTFWRAAR